MNRSLYLLVIFVFSFSGAHAQLYERGKKNFFVEAGAGTGFINTKKWAFTGNRPGICAGVSVGKLFGDFFRTSVFYRFNSLDYQVNDTISSNTWHCAGIQADVKVPLFDLYMGKSKHYECTVLHNYFFAGLSYGWNFGNKAPDAKLSPGEWMLGASYGVKIKKSGSTKKQAAYDFYVLLNMKKGLNAVMKTNFPGTSLYGTYWGISLMLIHYRTGRWN